MKPKTQLLKYLIADIFSAAIAWGLFYVYRKKVIEPMKFGHTVPIEFGVHFYLGITIIPLLWLFFYYSSGYYRDTIRKSRLSELWVTLKLTFLGTIIIFFGLVLDDVISDYSNYYRLYVVLFLLHFTLTYFPRLIITTRMSRQIHHGMVGFKTLIIGGNQKAVDIYNEIISQPHSTGNDIIGFVGLKNDNDHQLADYVPMLGTLCNIKQIIEENGVEEVIIAIEYSDHFEIERIIYKLIDSNVLVKAIPGMYEIITGKVTMSAIMGTPLIEISHNLMPAWQENIKHFIDIIVSITALIISSPIFLALMVGVRFSSKGPIFYKQERIGKNGKPFTIYKFRSMYTDAESDGPELSSEQDPRITPIGRIMRKSRLDEIPNFINVLKGDMSLVGPRPERQHFIDQIVEVAPQYIQLLKVRPGITSWGQVKYGYAKNIDEMTRRMKYDLIYLDNMSLYVDFKILIYTVLIIIQRKGM